MNAVQRENDHHREVRDEHGQIEPVPLVGHRGERVVEHQLELVAQAVLGREDHVRGHPHGQPLKLDAGWTGKGSQTVQKRGKQGEPPRSGYRQL